MDGQLNNKNFTPLIGLLSLFLLALIVFTAVKIVNDIKASKYIGQGIQNANTISVSGKGEIYAKPDLAIAVFSVVTEAKTVSQAMSDNTTKMNAVTDFMKQKGIAEADLKTINFNVSPHYDWYDTQTCITLFGRACPNGQRVLVGYDVTQSLQVKIRDMQKIGEVVQGATDKGANEVGDLQFTIDKEENIKAQAREQAIKDAKAKAQTLASQLGVKLSKIVSFSESGVVPYYYLKEAAPVGLGGGGAAPQIQTGENKIEVTVNITYQID